MYGQGDSMFRIWYEYGDGNVYPNLPFEKIEKVFKKLWEKYQYDPDKDDFKFFQVCCDNGQAVVFTPSTLICTGLDALTDPNDKKRLEELFSMRKNK